MCPIIGVNPITMKKNTIGIFESRQDAEKFINRVHNELAIENDEISYIYKNTEGEEVQIDASEISSKTPAEGAEKGAKAGAVIGAIAGIATVAGVIPVIGPLFAAGPVVTALGITGAVGTTAAGAVTGAAVGGLIGALANMGVGKEKAKAYEDAVVAGNILVAVHSDKASEVEAVMIASNAQEVQTYEVTL